MAAELVLDFERLDAFFVGVFAFERVLAFFAGVFWDPDDRLAVDFLAVDFLAVDFLAVDLLAVARVEERVDPDFDRELCLARLDAGFRAAGFFFALGADEFDFLVAGLGPEERVLAEPELGLVERFLVDGLGMLFLLSGHG